jgi:hypothetical protein
MEVMEVIDYATGAKGSYCIRRVDGIYASYWNPNGWAGSGYVFADKRIAEALCILMTDGEVIWRQGKIAESVREMN